MRIYLIGLYLFSILPSALAQTTQLVFGNISTEEMTMESYEKDPEAKAVILYDKGESIFFDTENGYDIRFRRHKRIKIFDKSASEYSEFEIPFYVDGYGRTETIKSIDAYTYTLENGRIHRKVVDPSMIYEEQISKNWFRKKFVFPDVQNGSVLEVQYELETPFHFNLPDWTFQNRIPTIYSEYQVSMIPFYEYIFSVQGISRFDYQHSEISKKNRTWGTPSSGAYGQNTGGFEFQDYIHTYVMKDVPAFEDESFITSVNDYIIKMDFQLSKFHSPRGGTREIISTWPALNESLIKHESFGKYQKGSSRIAKKILSEELTLGQSPMENTKLIIDYVKNNFEWDGFNSKYASQSPKDFYKNKKGNAADINLFLLGILDEAGIRSYPVILSTRNHGKIANDYPFDHYTNYVIAMIDSDFQLLADATENMLPYNRLPLRCFNEKGLMVKDSESPQWISLENNISSTGIKSLVLSVDTITKDLLVQLSIQATEYQSLRLKNNFEDDEKSISDFYDDRVGKVNRSRTMNYDDHIRPYSIFLTSEYETEKLGESIIFKPFLNLPISKNSLTKDKRNYPVDFIYPWEDQFNTKLEIPNGYRVSEIPKPLEIDNDLAKINLRYSLDGNTLLIEGTYNFKKAIYNSNEYSRIKYYFNQIITHFNEPVLLEKI